MVRKDMQPTKAQADLLKLLRQGYYVRSGYLIGRGQEPCVSYVATATIRACHRRDWIRWTRDGWTHTETAP